MEPRVKSAPINASVHSASRMETNKSNSRTILAEVRFMRFYCVVYFDHVDEVFFFETYEHNKQMNRQRSHDSEQPLIDKFALSVEKIMQGHTHKRRFERHRGVNQRHLTDAVPGIRTFDPAKIPPRSLLDRYKPFDPNEPIDDDGGY